MSEFFSKIEGKRVVLDNHLTSLKMYSGMCNERYLNGIEILKRAFFEIHKKLNLNRELNPSWNDAKIYVWDVVTPQETFEIEMWIEEKSRSTNFLSFVFRNGGGHETHINDFSLEDNLTILDILNEYLRINRDWWNEKDT